jgi:hypothetical protein
MRPLLLLAVGFAPMALAAPSIELHGLVAASKPQHSFALVSVNRQPATLVGINGVIAGQLRLHAVDAHAVTLSDGRVLRPTPAVKPPPSGSHQAVAESTVPLARTEVTTRAPDQRGAYVERIHLSRVE